MNSVVHMVGLNFERLGLSWLEAGWIAWAGALRGWGGTHLPKQTWWPWWPSDLSSGSSLSSEKRLATFIHARIRVLYMRTENLYTRAEVLYAHSKIQHARTGVLYAAPKIIYSDLFDVSPRSKILSWAEKTLWGQNRTINGGRNFLYIFLFPLY